MIASLHIYRPDRDVLRVSQIVESSRSEGPGVRFCLWLQGCELRCPGCCNPEMFDFNSPNASDMPVAALVDQLRQARGIEGITLLGGEPFHQAPAAAALAAAAQELGLGGVVFTGYEFELLSKSATLIPPRPGASRGEGGERGVRGKRGVCPSPLPSPRAAGRGDDGELGISPSPLPSPRAAGRGNGGELDVCPSPSPSPRAAGRGDNGEIGVSPSPLPSPRAAGRGDDGELGVCPSPLPSPRAAGRGNLSASPLLSPRCAGRRNLSASRQTLSAESATADLLAHTDLLISGPYVAAARSIERPWVGSDNQQVHLLSARYQGHPDLAARRAQSVHVQLLDGDLRVTGWPGAIGGVSIRRPVRPTDEGKS